MALTGCRPGKRTMKVKDYGKMAATFINLETKKAVRLATIISRKEQGRNDLPDMAKTLDEELFSITPVDVNLKPEDMPGKPLRRRECSQCGESIMDGREIESSDGIFCVPCFEKTAYYRPADPQKLQKK
jgi:formylmethanofuran dehydrogenase subunit E